MEFVDESGDDEIEELESVPVQNNDEAVDAFNIIEVKENNKDGLNLLQGDRLLDLQQINDIFNNIIMFKIWNERPWISSFVKYASETR